MTIASAKEQYNEWHMRYAVDRAADTPWHQLVLAHLDPVRDLHGKRVMEIACGRGGFAVRLMRMGTPSPSSLVAADFSTSAVAKGRAFAQEVAVEAIRWEVADAQALCHADASFDTVISCETVEHLPRPSEAVVEFARILRPGGRLLLTTPNYMGPMGAYRGYARLVGRPYREEGQPINRFTTIPRTLSWIRSAGLSVHGVEARGHYLPWPGRPPVEISRIERIRLLRWLALHSLIVAEKPLRGR